MNDQNADILANAIEEIWQSTRGHSVGGDLAVALERLSWLAYRHRRGDDLRMELEMLNDGSNNARYVLPDQARAADRELAGG